MISGVYLQGTVKLPEGGVFANPRVGRLCTNDHRIILHIRFHVLDHTFQSLRHLYSSARQAVFQALDLEVNFTVASRNAKKMLIPLASNPESFFWHFLTASPFLSAPAIVPGRYLPLVVVDALASTLFLANR